MLDKTALVIIQDADIPKSKSKAYSKISTLPLHNAATLETQRRRFDFVNGKVIKQLLNIIIGIKIIDINALKPSKEES